jgi:two-component system, LytTR family, sensor kinase
MRGTARSVRRTEGFVRRAEAVPPEAWARIALVPRPADPKFIPFWKLQALGWIFLCVLQLLLGLPNAGVAGFLKNSFLSIVFQFLASCLLLPVCRSLSQRSLSWIALELCSFAWSLLIGAVSCFAFYELVIWKFQRYDLGTLALVTLHFTLVLFLWCNLYFSIHQWRRSAEERERLLRAEAEAREARLAALRNQLNPHFLFNSLNAASTLVLTGQPSAATRMLAQIGELLRRSLESGLPWEVPLAEELAFVKQYLAIEQTRLGERLQVDLAIAPETLEARVPSMLLQPLVENAVRHGVAELVEGGRIAIESSLRGRRVRIVISNPGPAAGPVRGPAEGVGLRNTRERLQTLYGTDHALSLEWPEDGGCIVTVELPFHGAATVPEAACAP